MSQQLLIELFSEEIPARMQAGAAKAMLADLSQRLTDAGLSFGAANAHYGPRRLSFVIEGLPAQQPDTVEERKGPKKARQSKPFRAFCVALGWTAWIRLNCEIQVRARRGLPSKKLRAVPPAKCCQKSFWR